MSSELGYRDSEDDSAIDADVLEMLGLESSEWREWRKWSRRRFEVVLELLELE